MEPEMTDLQIMAVALGNMITEFESVDTGDLATEAYAMVAYCRRVVTAAEAGDLAPIRAELAEDERRDVDQESEHVC